MKIKKDYPKLAKNISLSLIIGTSVYLTNIALAAPAVTELPTGGTVTQGAATISSSGATMTINQGTGTPFTLINWNSFNIGTNATVNITQHTSSDILVNNVTANSMSEIYGNLNATANVVIINPNGILFNGATVNVGGLAVSTATLADTTATSFSGFANDDVTQGNITIVNSTIKSGIGAVLANSLLPLPADYAIDLGTFNDEIRLIANGNVEIDGGTLQAIDKTTLTGTQTLGTEEYEVSGDSSSSSPGILIRADANADDYGTVTINGTPVINTSELSVYYNPTTLTQSTTADGVKYNKKDYTNPTSYTDSYTSSAATGTLVEADQGQLYTEIAAASIQDRSVAAAAVQAYMLVNNIAQLQDISDTETGNLDGTYALGKDIDATDDTASYYDADNQLLYRTDENGNIVAISVADGGTFNSDGSGKTVNGKTISSAGGSVSDGTYTYDGANTSDSTYTLSADNSIVSAAYNHSADGTTITRNSDGTTITGTTVTAGSTTYSISGNVVTTDSISYTINGAQVSTTADGITYTASGGTVSATDAVSGLPTTIPGTFDQTAFLTAADNVLNAQSAYSSAQTVNTAMNTFTTAANTDLATALTQFTAIAADASIGQAAQIINSALWNNNLGFDPIGDEDTAFTGIFDGFGGDATHTISNLTIQRPEEDNVGLFGITNGATLRRVRLSQVNIAGHSNVGALAGSITNNTAVTWSHVGGTVKSISAGEAENIGGLVGLAQGSSITGSTNSANVTGQNEDGTVNITSVGGIAGQAVSSTINNVANAGHIKGEKDTGGLIGTADNLQMSDAGGQTGYASYNKGQVDGIENTGGIAGSATDSTFAKIYNTNEQNTLSAALSALNTDLTAIRTFYATDSNESTYGQITGTTNTGGLFGLTENTTVDTAYNAGNVYGATNTGGLIGQMTGSTSQITNAYNADNNTVIQEKFSGALPSAVQAIISGSDVTTEDIRYYSFYTLNEDGSIKAVYYFIPTDEDGNVRSESAKGATGYYVDANGNLVDPDTYTDNSDYVANADRYYMNRLGYLDANVSGTDNTGGLVGYLTDGTIDTTYNAGTVTGSGTASGGLVGSMTGGELKNSFYVTGTDLSTQKIFSGQTQAVGSQTGGTVAANIAASGYDFKLMRQGENVKTLGDDGTDSTNWIGAIQDTSNGGLPVYTSVLTDIDATVDADTVRYFSSTEGLFTLNADNSRNYLLKRLVINGTTYYVDDIVNPTQKYTLSVNPTTNQLTFTLSEGSGSQTIEIYPRMVSSNQGENWLIYQNSTLPLLQAFLTSANLDRVFEYDGTTHNLETQDVDNLYGRADFDDGAGKNVWTDGYTESSEYAGSSEYHYDESTIWSPQHAYQLDSNAQIIITPKAMTVTVSGEKTYGNYALTGYYIQIGTNYYQVIDSDDTDTYPEGYYYQTVSLSDGETISAKAKAEGKYLVVINGFVEGEGLVEDEDANIKSVMSGLVTMLKNSTSGNSFVYADNSNSTEDTLQLNAGTYSFSAGSLGGLTADYKNYALTYSGSEQVNKADLYYTVDGVRNYGESNVDGAAGSEYTFTLVGIDSAAEGGSYTSTAGYLKSWDATLLGGATLEDITDDLTKNGISYTIKYDSSGGAEVLINNQTHVIVDANSQVTAYNISSFVPGSGFKLTNTTLNNNYNLVWKPETEDNQFKTSTAANTFGTVAADIAQSTMTLKPIDLTVTINGERDYGSTMDTSDSIVYSTSAADGKWAVTVTGTAANGRDNSGNTSSDQKIIDETALQAILNLVEGLPENTLQKIDATTYVKRDDTGTVTVYDLKTNTVYSGSVIDIATLFTKTEGTDNRTVVFSPDHNKILDTAYQYDYLVTNGNHSLKIKPIDLTILTEGGKIYGQNNTQINYDYEATGLTDFDAAYEAYLEDAANYVSSAASRITEQTNAGTYGTQNGDNQQALITDFTTAEKTNADSEYTALANNYNIIFADTLTIDKRQLAVYTEGSKTYGNANPASGFTYSTDEGSGTSTNGLMNWDSLTGTQTSVGNGVTTESDAGTYGTQGTTSTNKTLNNTYTDQISNNYDITETDLFTINKRNLTITTEGSKVYGTVNPTTGFTYTVEEGTDADSGLISKDADILNDASSTVDANKIDRESNAGVYGTLGEQTLKEQVINTTLTQDDITKNYNITYQDKFTIDKALLTIITDGSKIYGQTNDKINYTYSYDGLTDFDQTDYDSYLTDNTSTYSKNYATGIDETTDAGSYGTKVADSSQALVTDFADKDSDAYQDLAQNYEITYADQLNIAKRQLAVYTEGSKTYGELNPTTGFNYSSDTGDSTNTVGLMDWDSLTGTQTSVGNGVTTESDAGTYGTQGTTSANKTLNNTYTDQISNNYDITETDLFAINKKDLTYLYTGEREFGRDNATGTYSDLDFTGLTTWDEAALSTDDYTLSNAAVRTTAVGTYADKLEVELTGDLFKNYNYSGTTSLEITKAEFTYVADHTEYWQGQNIPDQTGRIYNSHGEDVSDLVGTATWNTPATRYSSPDYYEIIGSGTEDNSGNYDVFQYGDLGAYNDFTPGFDDARDNYTALKIKANQTLNYGEIYGPWGPYRKPLLDIRYLTVKGTEGINRIWSEGPSSIGNLYFIGNKNQNQK